MLPFLQKVKPQTGVVTQIRKPDQEQPEEDHAMTACAQDLLEAIQANDRKALASALRAMFEILESEPHHEGEHLE